MVREGGVNIANLFDIAIVAHDQILYTLGKHLLEKKSANGERGGVNIVNVFDIAIVAHDQILSTMGHIYYRLNQLMVREGVLTL